MQLWCQAEVNRLTNRRAGENAKAGNPGPEMTIAKLAFSELNKPLYEFCVDLMGADALIICTEWQHFRAADFEQLALVLRDKVIFDGRNMYDPAKVAARGLTYYAIGRGASVQK